MSDPRQAWLKQADICKQAITNTAARLGVDPVAFAEACRDGEEIAEIVNSLDACQALIWAWMNGPLLSAGVQWKTKEDYPPALQRAQHCLDKLAALKHSEPGS